MDTTSTTGHPLHGHVPWALRGRREARRRVREQLAYERAAEVGMRAVRRRGALCATGCHFTDPRLMREQGVGPVSYGCLPPRLPTIRLTVEWLHRHHGLVATVSGGFNGLPGPLLVTLHASEANVLYVGREYDPVRLLHVLRRVDG